VSSRQETLWTPSFCKDQGFAWRGEKSGRWQLEGAGSLVRFNAVATVLPSTGSLSAEAKRYYREHMSVLTDQPPVGRDMPASVLETTTAELVTQQEWEREWSTKGLKSGLSEKVRFFRVGEKSPFASFSPPRGVASI
jgi:hypothetical protein